MTLFRLERHHQKRSPPSEVSGLKAGCIEQPDSTPKSLLYCCVLYHQHLRQFTFPQVM